MKEYIIKVNGRPVFGCFLEGTVAPIVYDLRMRFGKDAVIVTEIVTTESYDISGKDTDRK